MKLRKGVKFHSTTFFTPTRDFNADDVLFSLQRQKNKDHPYHSVGGGNYPYWVSLGFHKLINKIKKIDNHTIQFVLNYPEAPFLNILADGPMSVFSKEYADQLAHKGQKERIDNDPIGTGPFVFKSYVEDSTIRYKAHESFWGGRTQIDELIFSITPDASVRYQKLKTGECHLIAHPSPTDLESMKKHPQLKLAQAPGINLGYLSINVLKKPFDNVLVRRAIYHALNRQSYVKAIYLGHATVATSPLPPTSWGHISQMEDNSYNLERAKKLLTEAGFPNGFKSEIWTLPVARPYNPNGKKMGEMMQADLAKVGIQIKLVTYDWSTYLKKMDMGEHSLAQIGWSASNGDPDSFLNTLLSCSSIPMLNASHWCHKKFDKLMVQAKSVLDRRERKRLYKLAQNIFQREIPWVGLAHATIFVGMNKKVKGFKIDPRGDIFQFVDLESKK